MQAPSYGHNKRSFELPLRIPNRAHPPTRRSGITIMNMLEASCKTDMIERRPELQKDMEIDDYSTLQLTMTHKLKTVEQNINICKEKSKIKDQQMLALAELIENTTKKIDNQENKYKKKQKKLQNLSIKCQGMTETISKEQQRIKKQAIYLHEQNSKYNSLQQAIHNLELSLKHSYSQLDRKQKICQGLEQMQNQNNELREHYHQLLDEQKLIEYRQNQDNSECQQLENKIEHLNKVLKDRTKINKNNQSKLSKLNKDIDHLEYNLNNKKNNLMQIKDLELQIGQLNQDLLLINDHISETQFKISRKTSAVEQLRDRIYRMHEQVQLKLSSKKKGSPNKKQSEMTQIRQEVQHNRPKVNLQSRNSKPVAHIADLTNLTPTFPSNELEIGSEAYRSMSPGHNDSEAFQNIEKLIMRYEKIKNRESELE